MSNEPKFKIGDKVTWVENSGERVDGVVEAHYNFFNDEHVYRVRRSSRTLHYIIAEYRLTLLERPDKPMCKVGEDVAFVQRETYDYISHIHGSNIRFKKEYSLKIMNVVFRPDKRRVTIVFDGFSTRATCKEGEEYRPLLGFLIAYFKAVKMLQGWNGRRIQRFFEGVLYYLPPEEQEAYLKAVYFENAKPTFKQALALFDDVEAYWEKRL
jgi:hypothetical protein